MDYDSPLSYLILAAGLSYDDESNKTNSGEKYFDPLGKFLDKPLIAWQLEILHRENVEAEIIIVVDYENQKLISFLNNYSAADDRIRIVQVKKSSSILDSLLIGLGGIKGNMNVTIVFSDVLIANKTTFQGNRIFVSEGVLKNRNWSFVELDKAGVLQVDDFPLIPRSVNQENAIIGRFEFANVSVLREAVEASLRDGEVLFSSVILRYHNREQLKLHRIPPTEWFDFGHKMEAQLSQRKVMNSRFFNRVELTSSGRRVEKTSVDITKLKSEWHWYKEMSSFIPAHIPSVFKFEENALFATLELEFVQGNTLAEIQKTKDKSIIVDILRGPVLDILKIFAQNPKRERKSRDCAQEIYISKTYRRLNSIERGPNSHLGRLVSERIKLNGIELPSVFELLDVLKKKIEILVASSKFSLLHGDLCFSNIILSSTNGLTYLIDPRGNFGQRTPSIYGDLRYDVAKLSHSYVSGYDYIKDGLIHYRGHGLNYESCSLWPVERSSQDHMTQLVFQLGLDPEEISIIEGLLFLSMLPLHNDEPSQQIQMLLTALDRLFSVIQGN